ncbi:PREDICTED: serine proteinase stubble [Nicrophorus vespilloides]|uniref:Serine proteinase stubble n=1 Tax=Nicrophorus vespilloides TaxID=110193 RepID=A0ABM1MBU5_NICVS|nr:PREDICTED: serine proteinase stubble [Nicrophorus vespilloides]
MLRLFGIFFAFIGPISTALQRSPGYQISPKPCWVDGMEGTCMFVYECIKSEGFHIGMCVDSFMFGSCCAHNATQNSILPISNRPSVLYTPPSQATKRPTTSRPKQTSRPHGGNSRPPSSSFGVATSLNVRTTSTSPPPPPSRFSLRPMSTDGKPSSWHLATSTESFSQNSISHSSKPTHHHQWQVTTEPGFVTKVRTKPQQKPTSHKPTSFKPKPTKKPTSTTQKITKTTTTTTTPRPTTMSTMTTRRRTTTARTPSTTAVPEVQKVSSTPEVQATSTLSAVSASSANSIGCGQPPLFPQPQTRIVGGKNAPFGRWPWQVSVRRTSFFGFSSTHRCGGAILNENWIATAGHCVDDLLTSQIRIRVGEYDFSSVQEELPYVERAVKKKIVHPLYNFFTYEYDLALVQLDKSLDFAPHISPICLPATDDLLIGENATVTGWGRLSEGGTLPSVLQEVQVPIVSNDRCKSMFLRAGRHEFIPDIFLCAGHENGGQDSCQGDSGGPLQVRGKDGRYFLAGIISWGIGCAEANLPGVCTRISKFVPWILNNVT